MRVTTLINLKNVLGEVLKNSETKYPVEINYNKGINCPKYKITIELVEEDFFIDAKGTKWVKAEKKES